MTCRTCTLSWLCECMLLCGVCSIVFGGGRGKCVCQLADAKSQRSVGKGYSDLSVKVGDPPRLVLRIGTHAGRVVCVLV